MGDQPRELPERCLVYGLNVLRTIGRGTRVRRYSRQLFDRLPTWRAQHSAPGRRPGRSTIHRTSTVLLGVCNPRSTFEASWRPARAGLPRRVVASGRRDRAGQARRTARVLLVDRRPGYVRRAAVGHRFRPQPSGGRHLASHLRCRPAIPDHWRHGVATRGGAGEPPVPGRRSTCSTGPSDCWTQGRHGRHHLCLRHRRSGDRRGAGPRAGPGQLQALVRTFRSRTRAWRCRWRCPTGHNS